MASSRNQTQVTWSSGNQSVTLSASGFTSSDFVALNVEDWDIAVQVSADNQGTPASGDILEVYAAFTAGDVLGDSNDDYDTDEHATFLGVLDTYSANTPGEDPARRTFPLPTTAPERFKLVVRAPQAGTRNIVVRARVVTHRFQ